MNKFSVQLAVLIAMTGCASNEVLEVPSLSEAELTNCRDVGLGREACRLVAQEIDRLREAGDFEGLKQAYRAAVPDTATRNEDSNAVVKCRPTVEQVDHLRLSCGYEVVVQKPDEPVL